jgi:hypothetical protein
MSVVTAAAPSYRCTVCDARWSYRAVQYAACCRDCGGGLRRVASSDPASVLSATSRSGRPDLDRVSLPSGAEPTA